MSGKYILCCRSHSLACFLVCSANTSQLVEKYEKQCQRFMASSTVRQFKQLFPASATPSKLWSGKETVTLRLEDDWGSETLDDLKKLVATFGVSCSHLHISKVEHVISPTLPPSPSCQPSHGKMHYYI